MTRRERGPGRAVPAPLVGTALIGIGMSVPPRLVGNREIAARLGVDEQWISSRTGTRTRHVAGHGERLEQFAAEAARVALKQADVDPGAVDVVLVGTTTPDEMSPHAAPLVAADIGAERAGAVDISAACTGFLSCLAFGTSLIEAGRARTVVVVGADLLTRYLDKDDRSSAMLFGDGAGAAVLTAVEGPSRIGPIVMHSDGGHRDLIRLGRDDQRIRMDGPAVYRHAVAMMVDVTGEALAGAEVDLSDIDLFVYHQANARIIQTVGARLGVDPQKVVNVVGDYANTSAASLPIALAAADLGGRLHPGDRVLLAAFGAGLVWGATVIQWDRASGQGGRYDVTTHP